MSYKEILSMVAISLTFFAFIPYIYAIAKGHIRPHSFSWVIWGSTTLVVFFAQLHDGAGTGAWAIGVSGVITIGVAILAYSRHIDSSITLLDWFFLGSAALSLLLWYQTSDPLWTVIILTVIDILGFGPTLRKAYIKPFEEQTLFYILMAARNLFVVIALEHYSITTVLFPAATGLACILLIMLIFYRRLVLDQSHAD